MENPGNKIKAQFDALYTNQEVLFCDDNSDVAKVSGCHITDSCNGNLQDSHLSPRSVSDLTDEEYKRIAHIVYYGSGVIPTVKRGIEIVNHIYKNADWPHPFFQLTPNDGIEIDAYLKSIGCLTRFTCLTSSGEPRTLSPEEIIELGWVQILTT